MPIRPREKVKNNMASNSHSEKMFSDKLESYLIASAKGTLQNDICGAKAWLLTAKVLYPHKFGVQVSYSPITHHSDQM